MAYAPTVTVSTDANPSPRGLVVFPSLAAGTQVINVTKVVEGRTYDVRGGLNLFAVGGASVLDLEVAIGAPMTYRAEMFDGGMNSLGFTDATAVTVPAYPSMRNTSRAWISQPLAPSLAVQVSLELGSADTKLRKSVGDTTYAEGAALGTWIGSRRQGLSGLAIKVLCDSTADADEFQQMFGGYTPDQDFPSVVCIRTAAPLRIPRILFAATSGPVEIGTNADSQIEFEMTVDEVLPPSPGLVLPTLRRIDIDAAFATRAQRAAAYATRLARDTDYTKAGLAG